MNLVPLLEKAGEYGPVLFGLGFLAPLIAQSLDAARVETLLGLSTLQLGLLAGAALGSVAKLRGRWL